MMNSINNAAAISAYQRAQDSQLSRVDETKDDKALREQTDQFESILLKFMLESAIKNDDTLYPKQPGSDIYHSMYIDNLSQELSGSFGYSELLFNYLKEQQSAGRVHLAHRGTNNHNGK